MKQNFQLTDVLGLTLRANCHEKRDGSTEQQTAHPIHVLPPRTTPIARFGGLVRDPSLALITETVCNPLFVNSGPLGYGERIGQ